MKDPSPDNQLPAHTEWPISPIAAGAGPVTLDIHAAGLADARREIPGPVTCRLRLSPRRPGSLIAADAVIQSIHGPGDPPPAGPADVTLDRTDAVLIPGLVNPHTHLDLSSLGPRPHDPAGGFAPWLDMIRTSRPIDRSEIKAATRHGVALSLRGGVVAVGDIAGAPRGKPSTAATEELVRAPLHGVSYIELFGIGTELARAQRDLVHLIEQARRLDACAQSMRVGLQPHAPNTTEPSIYEASARAGLPLSTHLAESLEERRFIADAEGPQREFLEMLGLWSGTIPVGFKRHPVMHTVPALGAAHRPVVCAHVNDATDEAIDALAETGAVVAWCPRSAAYFGNPRALGPHRWREMRARGVPVAIGTDSIVNLDTPDRISSLDDARRVFRDESADARTLIEMITTAGAAALGLDAGGFLLEHGGRPVGMAAVPIAGRASSPAAAVMTGESAPEMLFVRNDSCLAEYGDA